MKFSVKRDKDGTAHKLEITPRSWAERSIVSRNDASERAWTIGAQRYLKDNWPTGFGTGAKLDVELTRMAQEVFVYGGPSKAPVSAASAGIVETDTIAEALAKLRAAGVNVTA